MPLQVLFGVDMETDVGSFTPFYEGVKKGTPILLDLFAKHGVKGTFFFTGESARENPAIAQAVAASPNEVGCHSLLHDTMGDELFPIPGEKPILPEEMPLRVKMATEWVEQAAGVRPVSFRCPRLWGSTALVNTLEELGYIADATYPMYFYRERFAPYHPAKTDWTQPGDMKILEIPNFADMTMVSADSPLERDRDQWPLLRTEGADVLMKKIRGFVEFVRGKGLPEVVCLYIHPWEFIPMERSFHFGEATVIPDEFVTKNCGEKALAELEKLIEMLKEENAQFVTAGELTQMF